MIRLGVRVHATGIKKHFTGTQMPGDCAAFLQLLTCLCARLNQAARGPDRSSWKPRLPSNTDRQEAESPRYCAWRWISKATWRLRHRRAAAHSRRLDTVVQRPV